MRALALVAALPAIFVLPARAEELHSGDTKALSYKQGVTPDGESSAPSIGRDGRWVAFNSDRTNLTDPPEGNGKWQIILLDRKKGSYQIASRSSYGDLADNHCEEPAISANGRYVVFSSLASNLCAGDNAGLWDVFRHDRKTGETLRVSLTVNGMEPNSDCTCPCASADGRYVAYHSNATNLTLFPGNGCRQVFVCDMEAGNIQCLSLGPGGDLGNSDSEFPSINGDGRLVAFESLATNLGCPAAPQVYVRDRLSGTTTLVSRGHNGQTPDGTSFSPHISENGRYVAFASVASNLTATDHGPTTQDVFVLDRKQDKMKQHVVECKGGTQTGGAEGISSNGRYLLIRSTDPGTLFVCVLHVDRDTGKVRVFSCNSKGKEANDSCGYAGLSGNGKYGVFSSDATNLGKDKDSFSDVFIHCK